MDLYDLEHYIAWAKAGGKGAKPKPYPRPWATGRTRERLGKKQQLTQDEVMAALRAAGHSAPAPN